MGPHRSQGKRVSKRKRGQKRKMLLALNVSTGLGPERGKDPKVVLCSQDPIHACLGWRRVGVRCSGSLGFDDSCGGFQKGQE